LLCHREAGGNLKFVKLLQEEEDIHPEFRAAILQVVLALAVDEVFQLAFRGANGLPSVVKILGESKDQVGHSGRNMVDAKHV